MMETLGQVWPQELYSGYGTEYNSYCQDFTGYNEYNEYNMGYQAHTEMYNTTNIYENQYILPENYYSLPPSPDYSSGSSLTPSPSSLPG